MNHPRHITAISSSAGGIGPIVLGWMAGSLGVWFWLVAVTLVQAQSPEEVPRKGGHPNLEPAPLVEAWPRERKDAALGLDDLEQMALQGNPSVGRAASLVNAARGNWVQVGLPPNPEVGYQGQQLGSGGREEQQGVFVTQEFVRGGKLRLNRAIADHEVAGAERRLLTQQQRVLTDVRIAYYQVLLAQRQIDLTDSLVRISSEGAEVVRTLFQAQEAGRADVLQAELEIQNAHILAENARNRHVSAWQFLTAVAANPNLPPQPLAGNAFVPPREIDFGRALEQIQSSSPEMAVALAEIDRARATVNRARAEPIPNVTVMGLVNVVDQAIDGPNGGVTISVPTPIYNRNQGAIFRAQQELAAAQRALEQLELDLQNRLAPIYERYANARNQVQRFQDAILPAASESLALSRTMYEGGEASYVGLLIAQRTYFQTNLNYLEAVQALRIAETEIEGLLLSDSLQRRGEGW